MKAYPIFPIVRFLFAASFLTMGKLYAANVTIDTDAEKWIISKHLTSINFVYTRDPDHVTLDGTLATWAKDSKVNTFRYPAGQASKFNWEDPSGVIGDFTLDPGFVGPRADPNEWMSLDEHLDFASDAGIDYLTMGVSYGAWDFFGDTEQSSIDRTVRQVKHINARGFKGGMYYLGNEDTAQFSGGKSGAQSSFASHAAAIKAEDPDIITVYNHNDASAADVKNWLQSAAGPYVDGVEFHGKWPNGGTSPPPGLGRPVTDWMTDEPLTSVDRSFVWRDHPAALRQAAAEEGRPYFHVSDNEYGLNGNGDYYDGTWDKYTKSLLVVDFLQEHFIGGYDMASFWSFIKGVDHKFVDQSQGFQMNPMHYGFEMLGPVQGGVMLNYTSDTAYVYGFGAKTDTDVYLYLINKTASAQPLSLTVSGHNLDTASPVGLSMVDTGPPDHWGTTQNLAVVYGAGTFTATLPAMSYNRVIIARDKGGDTTPPAAPVEFSARPREANVTLYWADNTEPDFAEYRVYRGGSVGGPYRLIATNLVTSQYTDSDTIQSGTSYHYVIQAVDTEDNVSPFSAEVYGIADPGTNMPPVFSPDPFVKANAVEGTAYSGSSIAADAVDPTSDPMVFSKTSGPDWLTVAANGDLGGTPENGDAGLNVFTVLATDSTGSAGSATLQITVDPYAGANQPAYFTSDPVIEVEALVGVDYVTYSATLADNAEDPESDTMTFSKVSGADWLTVAANGALSGTPAAAIDEGLHIFEVQVSDSGSPLTNTAFLRINVLSAPRLAAVEHPGSDPNTLYLWHFNQSEVYNHTVDSKLSVNEANSGVGEANADPGAAQLTGAASFDTGGMFGGWGMHHTTGSIDVKSSAGFFPLGADPSLTVEFWFRLDQLSSVLGDKQYFIDKRDTSAADGGYRIFMNTDDRIEVEVSNGVTVMNLKVDLEKTGIVANQWYHLAMTWDKNDDMLRLYINGDMKQLKAYTGEAIINSPHLLSFGNRTSGDFDMIGSMDDVRISDVALGWSELAETPPVIADPLNKQDAGVDFPYSGSILVSQEAYDLQGDTLTFSKLLGGPAWLSVASDGTLSGTPGTGDLGPNAWTIQVSDGNGGEDTATLNINVLDTSGDTILAAWETGVSGAPDHFLPSTTATLVGGDDGEAENSDTATWGTRTDTPVPTLANNAFQVKDLYVLTLQFTNNTGGDIDMDGLYLDYNRRFSGSPQDFTIEYTAGDLADATPVTIYTAAGLAQNTWIDHDAPFGGSLTDTVLADGESATFTITYSNASGSSMAILDNIALMRKVPYTGTLLAAWETGVSPAPDHFMPSTTSTLTGAEDGDTENSDTATWGTRTDTPIPTLANNAFQVKDLYVVTLQFTNNTGSDIDMDGLYMDYNRRFGGSPKDFTVEYTAGNLTDVPPVTIYTATGLAQNVWIDHDAPFAGFLTDTTLANGESATFTITYSNATGTAKGVLDNIALISALPLTDFESWQTTYFTGLEISGGDADRGNDFEDDGFINEYEYYFGLDPTNNVNARQPVGSTVNAGSDYPAIEYSRRILAPGVTYVVERSYDLSGWTDVTGSMVTVTGPTDNGDGSEMIKLRSDQDFTAQPKQFFRVIATE